MKKYLLAAVATMALGGSAFAGVCTTYGSYTSCSGANGYHSYNQTYGNGYSAGGDNRGNIWNSQRYGNSTFTNSRNLNCALYGRC